jgi:pimeloyl-ACP methyl ester carboxylesterase
MMAPEPFRIHFEQHVLDDLHARIKQPRWTRAHDDASWAFGTARDYLREIVAYWQARYDWRLQESRLNALPQFKAEALGTRVHFVAVPGNGPRPIPLLLLHGWPDSFFRFHKVIAPLSNPDDTGTSFDVVAPSLPGFAFTGPVRFPATQPTRHSAELLWHLMTKVLGHERFAVAGGDGGGVVAQIMAIDHPESIVGVHLTDLGWHVGNVDPAMLTRPEQKHMEESKKRFLADGAYAMVQATRPRSLAAALNDSPVGLASWILDRFHSWSDPSRHIDESFGKDDLLTNIMLYWATRTIGSSVYTYWADRQSPSLTPSDRVQRPVGMALFPKDIGGVPPRRFAERTLHVTRWTEMPRGSHFAALEEPGLYAANVRAFFRSLREAGDARFEAREEARHVRPAL